MRLPDSTALRRYLIGRGAAYERRTREGPCFICAIAAGDPEYRGATTMIHEDSDVLVFLNRYPTLRGYTLVCPRRHVEAVVGDFTETEYLHLQHWVWHRHLASGL